MPSTYTARNRLTKQATGENTNTWGLILNNGAFDLVDFSADGVTTISAGGPTTLSTANGSVDQARARMLNITAATSAAITIPSVEKFYVVRNASASVSHTITNGSSTVTIYPMEAIFVLTDGTMIWRFQLENMGGRRLQNLGAPTATGDACTKAYADALAFNAVDLPGQGPGSVNRVIRSDGAVASWQWALTGFVVKTGAYAASAGDRIYADTTGGAFTITLPASPAEGDEIIISDKVTPASAGWSGNSLTIARNGQTIGGLAQDMTCRTRAAAFRLYYTASNWVVSQ